MSEETRTMQTVDTTPARAPEMENFSGSRFIRQDPSQGSMP